MPLLFEGATFDLKLIAQCLGYSSDPGLAATVVAEGTNPATVKTTAALSYRNNMVQLQKAATDNIAIPAGNLVPVSSKCIWLLLLDSAAAFSLVQGTIVATALTPIAPLVPTGKSVVGRMQITTNGSTTYTPGTTDNSAAGITAAYGDLSWPDTGPSSFGVPVANYPDFANL